jgi:23S rRNA (guanosine2251-2'-O)-methyltransferase
MKQNKIYTYGKHALLEALQYAPQAVLKVFFDPKVVDKELRGLIDLSGVPTAKLAEGQARSDLQSKAAHQGIIGQISVFNLVIPYQIFAKTLQPTPHTALILLNGVQDPHNVGAIIRTSAGFGVAGVLLPHINQAPVTGAVLKVSAGMAFRIPLVVVGDVFQTIKDLKARGFKVYSLAGESAQKITNEKFDAPTLFILGNEGEGIPLAMRQVCDAILSIPINPQCESLNVAASASALLFAWSSQHPEALAKVQA